MSKGDSLLVPTYAMNTDKDVWGGDALEFKYALDLEPLLLEIHPDSLSYQQTRALGIAPGSRFRISWRVE